MNSGCPPLKCNVTVHYTLYRGTKDHKSDLKLVLAFALTLFIAVNLFSKPIGSYEIDFTYRVRTVCGRVSEYMGAYIRMHLCVIEYFLFSLRQLILVQ